MQDIRSADGQRSAESGQENMNRPVLERLGVLVPKMVERRSLSISLADYPEGVHAVGDIFFRKTGGMASHGRFRASAITPAAS
jgi:hypothetical protein